EFENIAIESIERLEQRGFAVTPSSNVLRITQNRLLEKRFVAGCGIPVAPFAEIQSAADLDRAAASIGFPGVLKTVRGGYDGKGQWRIASEQQAREALVEAGGAQLIYEQFIPFA